MDKTRRYIAPKIATLLLCATLFTAGFTACAPAKSSTSAGGGNPAQQTTQIDSNQTKKPVKNVSSLAEIKPTFSDTTWHGEKYVKIDEESLLQIIRVAMKDAEEMYKSIGSFNMKLDPKTHEHTDTFYPDWMNEYFFLSRAKKESVYMINYVGEAVNPQGHRAMGTMQVIPESIIPTLNQYMKDTYKSNIRFDDYDVLPSNADIKNYKTSSAARENLKQNVYDAVYVSICYDIYNAKCTGPNHKDYYSKFGGYDESIRQKVVTALYLFKRNDVISSLQNGTFNDKFGNSQYVKDILSFQKEAKNNHENRIEFGN